ncbi:probable chitinase 10 [Anopheles arabiensis]|uniref:Chitin-binding type-2 domain-containing protein n=2 Tax=gambiae species complex TaxID=44542 RepID=A0ABK8G3B0_ANOGA|nr:probable chitinase 10 [Anopheles arabiensis]
MNAVRGLLLLSIVSMCATQTPPVCDSTVTSFHPDTTNCNQYYTCYQGVATLQSCPDQKYFDASRSLCDVPENVPCTIGPCTGNTALKAVEIPNICTSYTLCVGETAYNRTCAEGTLFDSAYGDCVLASNSSCVENPCLTTDPATALPTTLYPVLSSCKKYIICNKLDPVVRTCAGAAVFSRTVSDCVDPASYVCPPGTSDV